jgi:hypothetical protein
MKYEYDDGGRATAGFVGTTGDCVVRAVAIATQLPYEKVYNELSFGCRMERKGKYSTRKNSARSGIHTSRKWFKDYMQSIGCGWTPCMGIGTGCKVHLIDGELPMGRLIVSVSKHLTAVIDGVIRDTFDPQRHTMIVENGITRFAGRCVYGYWRAAQ